MPEERRTTDSPADELEQLRALVGEQAKLIEQLCKGRFWGLRKGPRAAVTLPVENDPVGPLAICRSESPWRIRTRTCRYSYISNLRLLMLPLRAKALESSSVSTKFETLQAMLSGSINPVTDRLLYPDPGVAPLTRSATGSFIQVTGWLH